jgi:hypothetical protein
MTDRGWASTDLRWRHRSSSSPADTPRNDDPRGFVEDYGDGRASKGVFDNRGLCLWRLRTLRVNPLLVATVAAAASAASIQFTDSMMVTVASSLTIFMILVLLLQQRKLRKFGTFRNKHNELRRQVHYMHQERERLHRTMDRLDESVAEMHHIPQELHQISKNQNVDRLLAIVQEQKELQEKIRVKLNQQIMQQILTIVVREDRDQNWTLRPTEVEKIIIRLGLVEGIEFNETLFRQMLTEDPSVSTVMKIIRSLLERDDEYQHGTPIFKFKQ